MRSTTIQIELSTMNHSPEEFIEYAVNQYLQSFLRQICQNVQCTIPSTVHTYQISIKDDKSKETSKQCIARVKNKGWGRRCSRTAQENGDFCGCHTKLNAQGDFAWQKLGRIDEPAPEIFIEWYAKHNIHISNPKLFFAVNSPNELSKEERGLLNQAVDRYC